MKHLLRGVGVWGIALFLCGQGAGAWALDTGHLAGTSAKRAVPTGGGEIFRIEFRNADLREALRFLARIAGMNLVIPDEIKGTVNVSLRETQILDAINALTKSNGLDYAVERGILRVGKADQFTTSGEDLKTETLRLRYAVAKDMVDQAKQLLTTRGSVLADERTNSLVIRETMANIEHVKRFVDNVDVRDSQVLIEAKIIEATRDWSRALGIQWGVNTTTAPTVNTQGVTQVGVSDAGRRLQVNLPALSATSGLGLIIGTLAGGTNLDVAITAAEQRGDLHVISEPSIVTSNGVAARIRSGETIYVKTAGTVNIGAASAGGGGSSGLQSIKTGVELGVTPQISVGDYVKLKIDAVTSAPDFTRTVDGIPAIVDNTATTTVLVRDGEMTVIGGLIRFRGQESRRKVPYLAEVPLLGYLFQNRLRNKTNNDLMIFIRPRIVRDEIPSELQAQLPHQEDVKRDMTVNDYPHLPKARKPVEYRSGNKASARRWNSRHVDQRALPAYESPGIPDASSLESTTLSR